MLMYVAVNVAVPCFAQMGAIAVSEWAKSRSAKTCPCMTGWPEGAVAKRTLAKDCMVAWLGRDTRSRLVGSRGKVAGRSEFRMRVSVAPESAKVLIVAN